MAQIKNQYTGGLRTEAVHLRSGNKIITDAPVDNNGRGEAFSPTDLVCAALASCMMTVMGIFAEKEGIDISGMDADVTKIMAESPRRIAGIKVELRMPEGRNITAEQKEKLKKIALTCPVALSLKDELKQTISFNF